jgi:surface protein
MFGNCNNLTSLDLSNFNTSNVTNMDEMFNDCSILNKVIISNSDYNSINKVIEQLPLKTSDSMGVLYIADVDDYDQINIATANSKYWNTENYSPMFLEISSIMNSNKTYSKLKLNNKTIRIVIPYKKYSDNTAKTNSTIEDESKLK